MGKRSADEIELMMSGGDALLEIAKQLGRKVRELGGGGGDLRLLVTPEGEETLRKMARVAALRGECEIVVPPESALAAAFPVWKTVALGLHKDVAAYRTALEAAGYRIGDYASQILAKTEVATAETSADLVRLTVREMGFSQRATTSEIYAWAEKHGLKKCPAEVGPALRLAYVDQPLGEWIRVGMDPIVDSDGRLLVFGVGHGGDDRWLRTAWANPTSRWPPGNVWVFLRSKP